MPAPLGVELAVVLEMDQIESARPHELRVVIVDEDGGTAGDLKGGFQATREDLHPHENIAVPLAFDLRAVPVARYGAYDIKLYIDGQHQRTLTAWVAKRPMNELGG